MTGFEALTEEKIAELKASFAVFDADNDGRISSAELRRVAEAFGEGLSQGAVEDIVAAVDRDGDGQISFDEFLELLRRR